MREPESEHICEFCQHRAYWQCGECQTTQDAIWIDTSKLHHLESSHAELLEALKELIEERTQCGPLLTKARIEQMQELIVRATEEKQ